jgi:hypothetical protein
MNNPRRDGSDYDLLVRTFAKWAGAPGLVTHYAVMDAIPGTEILFEAGRMRAGGVWADNGEVRVLPAGERMRSGAGVFEWWALRDGKLAQPAAAPAGWPAAGEADEVPEDGYLVYWHLNPPRWKVTSVDSVIRALQDRNDDAKVGFGLFRCRAGNKPVPICAGEFAHPVVSADGNWAVATRSDRGWANPYSLVRVDLRTGEVIPLALPKSQGEAITRIGGKVLAVWAGEYRLIDPATGAMEVVAGEFGPLLEESSRPLQAAAKGGEVWATLRRDRTTVVGRYDPRTFSFAAVGEFPDFVFSSPEMWVDEAAGKVLVVVNGDVLRLPLTGAKWRASCRRPLGVQYDGLKG